MKKKVKIIILDFDGTLGDSKSLILNTMQATVKELGLQQKTPEEYASTIGLPLKTSFASIIPMSDEMADNCVATYRRIFSEGNVPGAVPLFSGVFDTLKYLYQKGYMLTLASSRSHRSLVGYVHEYGLDSMLSLILGADDVEKAKPDPMPVLQTLHHFGFSAEDAIVVGDTKFDILMGKNAGAMTCGVTYGNGSVEELREVEADVLINSFSEISQVLI